MVRDTILSLMCLIALPSAGWAQPGAERESERDREREREEEYGFGRVGEQPKELTPAQRRERLEKIKSALAGDNPATQDAAITLLATMGEGPDSDRLDARKASKALSDFIDRVTVPARKAAALRSLGLIDPAPWGEDYHLAARTIVKALHSPELIVRRAAAQALRDVFDGFLSPRERVGNAPGLRALDLLDEGGVGGLRASGKPLGIVPPMVELGWQRKWGEWNELLLLVAGAEPGLRAALHDPDRIVRGFAAEAVDYAARKVREAHSQLPYKDPLRVDPDVDPLNDPLEDFLGDSGPTPDLIKLRTHWAVLFPLNQILSRVVPDLQPQLATSDCELRTKAIRALAELGLASSAARYNVEQFLRLPIDEWADQFNEDDFRDPFDPFPDPLDPKPKEDPDFLKPPIARSTGESTNRVGLLQVVQEDEKSARLPPPRPENSKESEVPPDPLLGPVIAALRQSEKNATDACLEIRLAFFGAIETLLGAADPLADILAIGMRDRNHFVRWTAARTAGRFAPKRAETVVPGLTPMANDLDLGARRAALLSLRKIGHQASAASNSVALATRRGDEELRIFAIQTIEAIEPDVSRLLDVLIPATVQPDEPGVQTLDGVRLEAVRAIGRIDEDKLGGQKARAIQALHRALADHDEEVRAAAARELLVLGE